MTLEEFQSLRDLEDRRVRMNFTDGQVVIATLVSITSDFDQSRHIVYDNVEWSALPHPEREREGSAWYAAGEGLVSCVACSPDISS
jgi:small nuclear ribonucleoprotein (snRNP)-like protein